MLMIKYSEKKHILIVKPLNL